MEKTTTDISIRNCMSQSNLMLTDSLIKWRTNETNNKQSALENLFKCRRHLNDCVYADEGVRVSISVRCSLCCTGVWRYITRRAAAAAYTQCMCDFYIALLLYTCACASIAVYRKAIVLEVHKKRRLAFYYIMNIFLFVVIVIIFII